jgi:hypothetical protein
MQDAGFADMRRAHEALHRVGAVVPRVACATPDPEAQSIYADLIALRNRGGMPCGHTIGDLISGRDPKTGRRLVTKCGACLAERQATRQAGIKPDSSDGVQSALALARDAERERCATIVLSYATDPAWISASVANGIADAIRGVSNHDRAADPVR